MNLTFFNGFDFKSIVITKNITKPYKDNKNVNKDMLVFLK